MKLMKKVTALMLAVCLLCSGYEGNVLAVGSASDVVKGETKSAQETTEEETETEEKSEEKSGSESSTTKTEDSGNDISETSDDNTSDDNAANEMEESKSDDEEASERIGSEYESGERVTEESETEESSTEGETESLEEESSESALNMKDSGEVSRIEWLSALTKTFNMYVEEDNYPDNYYADIDSASDYYYDVMLATEFGLIDVEAGDNLEPDAAATREFAAHTLNLCMGFQLGDSSYTFNESDEVTYATDIQVAINREWFLLSDGDFLPDAPITSAEKTAMLEDAEKVLEDETISADYNSSYKFAADVIVMPDDTEAELTDDNEITLYNCSTELKAGDKFGIVKGGIPSVFKVSKITVSDDKTIIKVEHVELEDAFEELDIEGTMNADLASVQPYSSDVEINYIVGGTEDEEWEDGTKYDNLEEVGDNEISAIEAVLTYSIPDSVKKEFDLSNGAKAKITCKISDVNPDYSANPDHAYFDVDAKVSFDCNVGMNVLDAIGVPSTVELVRVNFGLIGYFKVELDLAAKGEVTFSMVENVSIGIHYNEKDGFRMTKDFHKDSFTIQAHVELSAGVTASVGVDVSGALKASLYAKVGAKGTLDLQTYDDGKAPQRCTHAMAWLYASVGGNASVNIFGYKDKWNKQFDIYTEKNSPARVAFHYEDGVAVDKCTREEDGGSEGSSRWKYYTPADSHYGYNGASSGTSSSGKPYTIFEYELDDYNNAIITSYKGNVSALSIPKTLDGYTVVGIKNSVFKDNTKIRVVVIPDSVTEIGPSAFSGCLNLTQVTLSKGLTSIGNYAFKDCNSLKSIEIPKSLESAGSFGAFTDCDGLKEVIFEEGTTKIVGNLFRKCTGIEEITIPGTVTEVGSYAFHNCSNLREVNIPGSVTEIGSSAFSFCIKLTEVIIPDSVTEIGSSAFADCINITWVTLSKGLTSIGNYAFKDCDSLTSIEIPKSLESAGSFGAFTDCDGLKEVIFEEGTTKIVGNLFRECTGIEEITIPGTVTEIGSYAFHNCSNLREVNIPGSVTEIGSSAFSFCIKLTEVIIPDSVTEIGSSAFADCINITQVTMSKGLTSIGNYAFKDCGSLTSIEIPKILKSAGSFGVFTDCDDLKEVIFEEGTTKIVGNLFRGCTGIEEITIPGTATEIGSYAFYNCSNLREINIPDSVMEIGSYAFSDCSLLQDITVPDSVVSMGNYIFSGCTNLKEATLPQTRVNIEVGTFKDCGSLEKVNFPETLEKIRSYAFYNTNLSEVILPDKVTTVETYAFYDCDSLVKIEVPGSTTSIGNYAFADCATLAEVSLSNGLKTIGNYAFNNCDALTAITIPDSVTSIGTYIFAESDLLSDVKLGTGITTIPTYAFNLCPSLQKIVLPYRITTINANAFTNCTALTEITIPRATTTIAKNVFSYPSKMTIYGISGTYAETYAKDIGAIFVNREVKATAVSFNEEELKVNKGAKASLILSVTPADFTDEVTWKSADTSIVTVADTGVITAKAIGTTTVKVTVGALSASCTVTVKQPVTSISLNKTSLSLEAMDTYTLKVSVSPSTAENKDIAWSTSDETIATIDENGVVTAISKGTATITVSALDGSDVTKSCNVTVLNNGYVCYAVSELESEHDYPVSCTDFWLYTKEGAGQLYVTFDKRTEIEENFDYIYIYNAAGTQVGKYTGKELAGQTIEVSGDTVKIKLDSDASGTTWGFKVTSITSTGSTSGGENESEVESGSEIESESETESRSEIESESETESRSEIESESETESRSEVESETESRSEIESESETESRSEVESESETESRSEVESESETESKSELESEPETGGETDKEELKIKFTGEYVDKNGRYSQTYIGSAIKPEIKVTNNGKLLTEGIDYTVKYSNNINVANHSDRNAPKVIVTGKGNYSGSAYATFTIEPKNIKNEDDTEDKVIIGGMDEAGNIVVVNGTKANPVIVYNGIKLGAKDYEINKTEKFTDTTSDKTIQITGKGNYTGTVALNVKVMDKAALTKFTVSVDTNRQLTYNGKVQEPAITVTTSGNEKKDITDTYGAYYVSYSGDKTSAGTQKFTVIGLGLYTGAVTKSYRIGPANTNTIEKELTKTSYEYVSTGVTFSEGDLKVVDRTLNNKELVEGKDYKVTYSNNKKAGVANYKIAFLGNYKGSSPITDGSFMITPAVLKENDTKIKVEIPDKVCKNGAGCKSTPYVTMNGVTVKPSEYTVTYSTDGTYYSASPKANFASGDTAVVYVKIEARGNMNFTGALTSEYTVWNKDAANKTDITKAKVTFYELNNKGNVTSTKITKMPYTGKLIQLKPEQVKLTIGNTEIPNSVYDYKIVNNLNKGKAVVIIKVIDKEHYMGGKTATFSITTKKLEN